MRFARLLSALILLGSIRFSLHAEGIQPARDFIHYARGVWIEQLVVDGQGARYVVLNRLAGKAVEPTETYSKDEYEMFSRTKGLLPKKRLCIDGADDLSAYRGDIGDDVLSLRWHRIRSPITEGKAMIELFSGNYIVTLRQVADSARK